MGSYTTGSTIRTSKFKAGDRILNINKHSDTNCLYFNGGKYGVVNKTEWTTDGERVHITYDDGKTGSSPNPEQDYRVIKMKSGFAISYREDCAEECLLTTKPKTIMENIVSFAKNLTLSGDEKLLRKMSLKDSCGDYTYEAERIVLRKLLQDNEAHLIEIAKAMEAEKKDTKKDN